MDHGEPVDPRWAETARRRANAPSLELPIWPVFAPKLPDQPCWLGEISRRNGQLVRIGFNTPGKQVGQELVVTNQLLPGGSIESLDRELANQFAADGRDYPLTGELPAGGFGTLPPAPRARPASVRLDGVATPAMVQREGEFGALRLVHDDVVITVTGRDLPPESVELILVSDLAPYRDSVPVVRRSASKAANWRLESAWHNPPDRSRPLWAHRGLLEVTTRHYEEFSVAKSLNRPHQRLDPDWGLWWAAAAAQQEELTGQDKGAAKSAVSDMVNQVAMLAGQANWWSRPQIRQRAVNQILWFTSTGDETLPTAAAQRLWAQRTDRRQDAALEAWATWAAEQR